MTRRSAAAQSPRGRRSPRSNSFTAPSSPLGGILTHTGRIRRSPHVRPRPETVLTEDLEEHLAMPGLNLNNHKTPRAMPNIESRNDHSPTDAAANNEYENDNESDNDDITEPPFLRSIFSKEKTDQKLLDARTRAHDAKRALHEAKVAASSIRDAELPLSPSDEQVSAIREADYGVVSPREEDYGLLSPNTESSILNRTVVNSPVGMAHDTNNLEGFVASPFSMMSIGSIDDFEKAVENLPSRFNRTSIDDSGIPLAQDEMLSRLDGTDPSSILTRQHPSTIDPSLSQSFEADGISNPKSIPIIDITDNIVQVPIKPVVIRSMEVAAEQQPDEIDAIGSWLTYFMGSASRDDDSESHHESAASSNFPHSCGSPIQSSDVPSVKLPSQVTTMTDATTGHLSYPEAFRASHKADPVLSDWVNNKFMPREEIPMDGTYRLGESKTIIVHEILRGNWTWCTAWSPDGNQLAIATENHHLAVVDTTTSTVWRVRHDRRVNAPQKESTTQSIRSIAWGEHFIAIGGIGNAVSILAPTEPYQVLYEITPTGFVGSIDWLPGSNKLLLGSREGQATIHEIWEHHDSTPKGFSFPSTPQAVREIKSKTIHTIDRGRAWVNSVQFKPNDTYFALGDSHGVLAVYSFEDATMMELANVANFKLEDSILDIQWSSDGNYLYAGGEDYAITVINTEHWEPVHKIKRDRWVQFISSSTSSTHLAVGGVTSEVSILDVNNGWENIINISTKGLVPLSANWHPDDQYLVLTGQDNSILAIETTNARHVPGHFLRSSYPILSIAFSPDGRMAAIGNEMGVVSIFTLTETTFVSVYEMVVECSGSLSVEWSPNGSFVVVAAGNKVVILSKKESLPGSAPPNTTGFFVAQVVRDLGAVHDVSIDPTSRFLAVSGTRTRVLHATSNFKIVLEMENGGTTLANSWSHDGKWFAAIGKDHSLVIYDTSDHDIARWQSVFTVTTEGAGRALAWGRSTIAGLQYCAYGGEDRKIHIMEIRTKERTWETVLAVKRDGEINDLDWNSDGLVAAAISNGTVTVLDLSYLQSGWAVNEMDYNWQRQALTCFTEIRRNRLKHSMNSVTWIPNPEEDSDNFLAIGGTDGELEIIDLAERQNCKGFQKPSSD